MSCPSFATRRGEKFGLVSRLGFAPAIDVAPSLPDTAVVPAPALLAVLRRPTVFPTLV